MRACRALLACVSLLVVSSAVTAQPRGTIGPHREQSRIVPGRYIVTLVDTADPAVVVRELGITPRRSFTRVMKGFSGELTGQQRAALQRDQRVRNIEPVRTVVKFAAPWGLDRIDQRALPLNSLYSATGTGAGVTVYVVDSGIRFDHTDFAGRAIRGVDVINDGQNGNDCDGHGTHVASTAAGSAHGVARGATLVSARVLDCAGAGLSSGIISALDWILGNAKKPAVVTMSLGGGVSTAMEDAVRRVVSAGIPVIVAAGNDGADACHISPARMPEVIAIAATNKSDEKPTWSNHGSCVDLFAPGDAIPGAYHTSSTALVLMSGTSMAAPHVAGAAALLLANNPTMSPSSVRSALVSSATAGVVIGSQSATSSLLFAGAETTSAPTGSTTGGVTINGTTGNDVVNATTTVSGQPLPTSGPDVLNGLAGNDSLSALAGNDTINGGDGNDTLIGGPGDDLLDGGAGIDVASYAAAAAGVTVNLGVTAAQNTGGEGSDTLQNVERVTGSKHADVIAGNGSANLLAGGAGNDALNGSGGNDTVRGQGGNDIINGGAGNDVLSGEAGLDRFRIDSPLDASTNVDRLSDFSVADDTVELSRSIFTALVKGTLPASAFRVGTAAGAADDRIVYDSATGSLFYDADGNKAGAQVLFARLPTGLVLTHADFNVID